MRWLGGAVTQDDAAFVFLVLFFGFFIVCAIVAVAAVAVVAVAVVCRLSLTL
jgi:hypothetical protein